MKGTQACLLAAILAILLVSPPLSAPSLANTFTVNESGDQPDANPGDGKCDRDLGTEGDQCTLRAAIQQANSDPGPDDIVFASTLATVGTWTNLPEISTPVMIDGEERVQLGAAGAKIGLTLSGTGNCIVRGLTINGFETAIRITSDDNKIEGNRIGGYGASNLVGIHIFNGSGNLIGGSEEARNVISGNNHAGIIIEGSPTTGNRVENNYIGINASGNQAWGNGDGIRIIEGAKENVIGGAVAARNVISGNRDSGILIEPGLVLGALPSLNRIESNYIGTDASGKLNVGNYDGITIRAPDNIVGGSPNVGNVISGNNTGVRIEGADATGNRIQGNVIGTESLGAQALPNTYGVRIENGASGNDVGGDGNGNLLSGNYYEGIMILGAGGNFVRGNRIGTNWSGTDILENGSCGISIINGSGNVVGGPDDAMRNLISGNFICGVGISTYGDGESKLNEVLGNYIGTDITGMNDLGNRHSGILIENASENFIGGNQVIRGNLISGNGTYGVEIKSNGPVRPRANKVRGNLIGTDVSGGFVLQNDLGGILINSSDENVLGADAPGGGNVISGNGGFGIGIYYGIANLIFGNHIGTDVTATQFGIGNGDMGIDLRDSNDTIIGGNSDQLRNVISNNGGNGIQIFGGSGIRIQGNCIGTDVAGALLGGNIGSGIFAANISECLFGGSGQGEGNVISGNQLGGIEINNDWKSRIEGNRIGTDRNGTQGLSNWRAAISLMNGSETRIGSPEHTAGRCDGGCNLISGAVQPGIAIESSQHCLIQGNFIGTDITGSMAIGSVQGIRLNNGAESITIGGTAEGAGNLISGNGDPSVLDPQPGDGAGIFVEGCWGSNDILGNLIGTDAAGIKAVPNLSSGIWVHEAGSVTIGGDTAEARNTISGNQQHGIHLATASSVAIVGNFIGTDITGASDLPNKGNGILVFSSEDNIIAGTSFDSRNVISGNDGHGIEIVGTTSKDNIVQSNFIGTNREGSAALGNTGNGILIREAPRNAIGNTLLTYNLISGNIANGIEISGGTANGNQVQGNIIGLNAAGTSALSNGQDGVKIDGAPGCIIGGKTATGQPGGNLVSGNAANGVAITGAGASGTQVQGNLIGTDQIGIAGVGNLQNGVLVENAPNTLIGGPRGSGLGNLISGNILHGVAISGLSASSTKVQGNDIGTNSAVSAALGNGRNGILLDNAPGNMIGGSRASAFGNVLSGNGTNGVEISGAGATGNQIQGNEIGTNLMSVLDLGNGEHGIEITQLAAENAIGGETLDLSNTIVWNHRDGVSVASGTGNRILSNRIYRNGGLGIDLGDDGITPNDSGDPDAGANHLQNFPTLTLSSGTILAALNSAPSTQYRFEFFSNSVCDPTGHGEGQTLQKFMTATTGADGRVSFDTGLTGAFISATATAPDGCTSEFSPCVSTIVQYDYGDAPSPYPTLSSSNGAYHAIASPLYLGTSVDSEADGQPHLNALGDDNNTSDDEDGVLFPAVLMQGKTADITIVASGNGWLNAWIDFNGDGDWADAGEHVFVDRGLLSGANPLSFQVPQDAAPGTAFARFRFGSQTGLGFTGGAVDGEVEDYVLEMVTIDTDGDGIPDSIEESSCTSPTDPDSDDDGLWDGVEDVNHDGVLDPGETDPCHFDTDGDGMPDGYEVAKGLDPLKDDARLDADGDGYSNFREYLSGTDPQLAGDVPPVISDLDQDADVDGSDLADLASELGAQDCSVVPCVSDLDQDGDVDELDLFFFTEEFGLID